MNFQEILYMKRFKKQTLDTVGLRTREESLRRFREKRLRRSYNRRIYASMARPQQKGPQQYKRRPRPRRFPQKAKKQLQEQKLSPENDSSSVISDGTEAEADYKTLDIKLENTTVETNEVLMISGGEW
eukprot:CAMPEP_0203753166 /NCGR_PEP_ID=MMETSP0098-20131031/6979_1 /ASSEMBLY_ACC=CAM_ASM_000208 /TAXON_ID=96639 /ORGANISM=" , Strain NY0313808BC1" /LENGTH=127 /DNA_ID=CAMNT_0050643643 /DNA_START=88 /DNA_END=468 /DNA_ORIENTATION=+